MDRSRAMKKKFKKMFYSTKFLIPINTSYFLKNSKNHLHKAYQEKKLISETIAKEIQCAFFFNFLKVKKSYKAAKQLFIMCYIIISSILS